MGKYFYRSWSQVIKARIGSLTNFLIKEIGQGGVAHQEPASGGDSVGLVLEFFRPQLEEVLEQVGLDQVGVNAGDSVDSVGSDNGLKHNEAV